MHVKRNVAITLFWTLWISIILTNPVAHSCTAFMMTDGEVVLVGNNEDYKVPYTRVWFIPAENSDFGRVYFGYDNWTPQGGMNDQGLFVDYFSVKNMKMEQSKDKPKGPQTDTMMAKCATVDDVLTLFGKYNLEWMDDIQMFVVDRFGESAIIEGEAIIRNCDAYQVVTNFRLSKVPEDQWPCKWPAWSCSRYKKAEKMLLNSEIPTVEHFRDILNATHRGAYNVIAETLYSNIYDLTNGLVYVYYLHDYNTEVIFNLEEELKKGDHYYDLPSLFGKELKHDIHVYKHESPAFSISYPKHFKSTEPTLNEVLQVKNPMSSTPQIGVYVEDQPGDFHLQEIGRGYLLKLVEKNSTKADLVYSLQTVLGDRTPANETLFERVIQDNWSYKTLVLSTYREGKLIYVATTSVAHPEALKEYLYSLQFH